MSKVAKKNADKKPRNLRRKIEAVVETNQGEVTVTYSVQPPVRLKIVGKSVAKAREQLKNTFNIDAKAISLVNGNTANDDYVLRANDKLEFVKEAGQKG